MLDLPEQPKKPDTTTNGTDRDVAEAIVINEKNITDTLRSASIFLYTLKDKNRLSKITKENFVFNLKYIDKSIKFIKSSQAITRDKILMMTIDNQSLLGMMTNISEIFEQILSGKIVLPFVSDKAKLDEILTGIKSEIYTLTSTI